jgi:hypothetical protein
LGCARQRHWDQARRRPGLALFHELDDAGPPVRASALMPAPL